MTIIEIVFWLLLVDSFVANVIAWTELRKYFNSFKLFRRFFPITRGWVGWYFVLVLLIGYAVYLN